MCPDTALNVCFNSRRMRISSVDWPGCIHYIWGSNLKPVASQPRQSGIMLSSHGTSIAVGQMIGKFPFLVPKRSYSAIGFNWEWFVSEYGAGTGCADTGNLLDVVRQRIDHKQRSVISMSLKKSVKKFFQTHRNCILTKLVGLNFAAELLCKKRN